MATMKAIAALAARPIDDPESLVDLEVDVPGLRSNDLLVEVAAVSVNPVDFKQRKATDEAAAPKILGYDAAGTVAAVGDGVEGFDVGDEVFYAGDVTRPGTNAEFHAVDHRIVGHKPRSLSFAEAAALPLTSLTAWESLFERFRIEESSTGDLLVLAGAGGVGSIMIQLARKLTGVRVLASASRPETQDWVRRMGAHEIVDHHDLVTTTEAVAPAGVDYLFTSFTEGKIEAFGQIVKPFGHITAIDGGSYDLTPIRQKSIAWHWELMFTRSTFETPDMAEQGRILNEVARLVDSGILTTTLTKVIDDFSAAGLREAHAVVESGKSIGKVVISRAPTRHG